LKVQVDPGFDPPRQVPAEAAAGTKSGRARRRRAMGASVLQVMSVLLSITQDFVCKKPTGRYGAYTAA
jgi:hypothetical protein